MDEHLNFEKFFQENYRFLYAYCLHILRREEASKDIVADVMEVLYTRRNTVKPDKWKSFAFSLAKHKCYDYLRHQQVVDRYAAFCLTTMDEAEPEMMTDELTALLQRFVTELPPRTRQILELCYSERKRYKEVAELLNISTGAVKKHMVTALKLIREKMVKHREEGARL